MSVKVDKVGRHFSYGVKPKAGSLVKVEDGILADARRANTKVPCGWHW